LLFAGDRRRRGPVDVPSPQVENPMPAKGDPYSLSVPLKCARGLRWEVQAAGFARFIQMERYDIFIA
jgi:hypothetical protein